MGPPRIRTGLRVVRNEQSVMQQDLAERAGISRQALSDVEAGRSCPSTAVALRLARALHCRVEDLFWVDEEFGPLRAELVSLPRADRTSSRRGPLRERKAGWPKRQRVALGLVAESWIAHPIAADQAMFIAADGIAAAQRTTGREHHQVSVELLRGRAELRQNLIAVGCDPALGLLSVWLRERHANFRLIWLNSNSVNALQALARGQTHLAGAHLLDEDSRNFNVPFVRSLFPHRSMVVVNLAQWDEGLVVPSGNPLRIRTVADLARKDVHFINRDAGAGARRLLDGLLKKARVPSTEIRGYQRVAGGHLAVAQAIAMEAADAGIATRAAALAYGLSFVPLAKERSDLVVARELKNDQRIQRIVEALESRAFRRELGSLGGYDVSQSGHLIEELIAR